MWSSSKAKMELFARWAYIFCTRAIDRQTETKELFHWPVFCPIFTK